MHSRYLNIYQDLRTCRDGGPGPFLASVIQQLHESEVHVQLHMAMEQSQARVICHEVYGGGCAAIHTDDVLHDSAHLFAAGAGYFEGVTVEMQRVDIAAVIVE